MQRHVPFSTTARSLWPSGLLGGFCLMAAMAALAGASGPARAATNLPVAADDLLAEDGFGACVPAENLDAIWLAFATAGKSARVPHVCMSGGCEDLPDIASWAAAQQYPEDIDLDRDEVQAAYAAFVAEVCGAAEPAETPPPEAEAEDLAEAPAAEAGRASLPPAPLLARALPPLLTPPGLGPRPSGLPGLPGGGTPRSLPPRLVDLLTPPPGWSLRGAPLDRPRSGPPAGPSPDRPSGPPWGPPPDTPPETHPEPPIAVMPLPAGMWLLLSALGLGALIGRRRG
jgi:hypothetical protein